MRANVLYLIHTENGEFYAINEPIRHPSGIVVITGMSNLQLSGEYAQPHLINIHGACVIEQLPHPRSVLVERFDHFTGRENEEDITESHE